MPILLDDKDKGNRRFTLLRSFSKLENGEKINKSVKDKEKVANFLAWLIENHNKKVSEYKELESLENAEKEDLE